LTTDDTVLRREDKSLGSPVQVFASRRRFRAPMRPSWSRRALTAGTRRSRG